MTEILYVKDLNAVGLSEGMWGLVTPLGWKWAVWSDGYIIFQYWIIYNIGNLPNSIKSRFKILPNNSLSF